METGSLAHAIADAILEHLRPAPVRLDELRAFAQALALSYLSLISHQSAETFTTTQLEPMRVMIRRGVKVEWLFEAIDQAGVLANELLKQRRITTSFATIIAKMVAAQANLQASAS